jgi:5-methylthioadenosine/S-adenosylhomocysteine deaminase
MAVLPGLVNAHTHLFQCFLRGLADDRPLLQWLAEATWPGGLAMTERDFYLAALLGFVENLKCGATSVLDQDYVQTSPRNMDAVAEAAHKSGARVLLARGVGDRPPYFAKFLESADTIIAETGRLVRRWNTGPTSRVRAEFGPMIPWGCQSETLRTIGRLAHEWDVGVHIHVSESRDEVQMSLAEFGLPPVRWLDEIGVLDDRWQLVHCVWLTPEEMDRVAGRGSLIVHCPVSNMYLASGIAGRGAPPPRGRPPPPAAPPPPPPRPSER